MVALMVAVTILTILTAMALPVWSQQMQREKEEELIFRGWQYAEAIRVFQQRHGRLPTRLEELIEVEPRSIRQLWKDPMTEDGEWGIVVQVGGGS
jgi:type II secretory pathway pseudopilin PulG